MTVPTTRFPLNPCDYLYYAYHGMMERRGQVGNTPFMTMELSGDVEPARLERAVERALAVHPALRSRAAISLIWGRPQWRVMDRTDRPAVVTLDLRDQPDWRGQLDAACQAAFTESWDMFRSPQVRLELYRLPEARTRICIRWPHAIMDAEGAIWFLSEVDRMDGADGAKDTLTPALSLQGRGSEGLPEGLLPDGAALDGLAGCGLWRRFQLFRAGYRTYHHHGPINVAALADGPVSGGRWRYFHREWRGADSARLKSLAARCCADGPAKMTRYLAACVLRALHAMFRERGAALPAYLVTMPTRLRGLPVARPVHGNYLVSATLYAAPHTVTDRAALLADLGRQIDAFFNADADKANWSLIWFAGLMRHWQYRWLLTLPMGLQPYASGFSSYGEIGPPLRSFVGAAVDNLWGCTSMNVPPGWNPAFSRFGDRLNLSLAWLEGYYQRETAARYLELIEREMFTDS